MSPVVKQTVVFFLMGFSARRSVDPRDVIKVLSLFDMIPWLELLVGWTIQGEAFQGNGYYALLNKCVESPILL